MAEIVPFKGLRYNQELIPQLADVVAPPYDVIGPEEQEALYNRHPNNVIRLILGKGRNGDTADDNVHVRAGLYFRDWIAQNILALDPVPAVYLTRVEFTSGGQSRSRFGLVARVRLEPFEKGIVLPHERTFSKVKSERLMLMKACHANFSPIFGLYTDGCDLLRQLDAIADSQPCSADLVDTMGHRHRMWCLTEHKLLAGLMSFFESKKIYIADGHHRYETALHYRDWIKENHPGFSPDHPANFVMMSLSSMADPGMTILPAHRLLKAVSEHSVNALLQRAKDFFDITPVSMDAGLETAMVQFDRALESRADQHAIGLVSRHPRVLQVMTLKEEAMSRLSASEIPAALRDLDVTILTHMVMMELMGFDQQRLDDETKIIYRTLSKDAVCTVYDGKAQLGFILNPTKIEQVRRVAENGLIMPRKSTYFYPKVLSGLVYNLLR